MSERAFPKVPTPEGCILRRKELYEYITPDNAYDVELYENSDGTFYAIGLPRDGERVIVYGSNVMDTADEAMHILVDKIRRESTIFIAKDEAQATERDG